ncbi:MAG TPA: NADH:flavin oxidoreductase, partial [Negativicutes bacterium]|nr:NADH:flavin oxidoreductase [Negativicutes bacterium]
MKTLFDKTQLSNLTLKNRMIRSATWENMADDKGHLTDRLFKSYETLAQGGVSLIITGGTYFTADSTTLSGMTGIYEDSFIQDYRKLTDRVHKSESSIFLQLSFAGRNGERWTPSSASQNDITSIVKEFGTAAFRAKQAGFDGVQIHAAHGFFLSQFLSRQKNTRTDRYG